MKPVYSPIPLISLAACAVLGLCLIRPAAAQTEIYTLSGVTFSDGASASGFFDYDPSTNVCSNFDITTSNGIIDGLSGYHYVLSDPSVTAMPRTSFYFDWIAGGSNPTKYYLLALIPGVDTSKPGIYPLMPGTPLSGPGLNNSGEIILKNGNYINRYILTGSLIVAAPEPSSVAALSIGILGLGALALRARRRSAA